MVTNSYQTIYSVIITKDAHCSWQTDRYSSIPIKSSFIFFHRMDYNWNCDRLVALLFSQFLFLMYITEDIICICNIKKMHIFNVDFLMVHFFFISHKKIGRKGKTRGECRAIQFIWFLPFLLFYPNYFS